VAGKTYEVAFNINARLAGGYKSVFSNAASTMGELQKRMSTLSKSQANIKSFESLKGGIAQTSKNLESARAAAQAAAEQMSKTAQPTREMQKQFEAANTTVKNLEQSFEKQNKKIGELRTTLTGAGVDTKNLAAEQARLAAQSEKYAAAKTRMEQSQGAVQDARKQLSWGNMKGELLGSAGIALALGAPIKVAANFQQAMAKTGAVLNASEEDMRRLTEQSRLLGRDTQFTATQAAQSQEMLARAGFNTDQILAAMPGMLNMAAAEGMDLAQAADIASSVLRGFNMDADQSTRVADVLAKTSAITNSSIASLGDSMKYVAPIAEGLGIPFEDTAAMIGVMANAGIKGSEAGTALRASLLRLSKEPKQTEGALANLGVAAKDSNGNLRTMPNLMKALSERMKGMGRAEKMANLAKIFGTEAASGMLAIMNAAESGDLSSITEQVYAFNGASAEMARRMNDTAQGAMKRFSSAVESLTIDIGNALLPTFTSCVEGLAKFTSKASEFAQKHPTFTNTIVKSVGALGALNVAIKAGKFAMIAAKLPFLEVKAATDKVRAAYVLADGSLIKMIKNTKLATAATKIFNAVTAANPILLFVLALVAVAGAFMLAYHKCEWFRNFVNSSCKRIMQWFTETGDWIVEVWNKAYLWLSEICGSIAQFFSDTWNGIKTGAAAVAGWTIEKWNTAAALLSGICTTVTETFSNAWDSISSGASRVAGWVVGRFEWMKGGVDSVVELIKDFFGGAFQFIEDKIQSVMGLWQKFKNFIGIAPTIPVPEEVQVAKAGAMYRRHALGGIFSTPHIGMVAEAGREAILPIDNPSRGIPLWMAAGRMMGLDDFGGGRPTQGGPKTENNYTFSFMIEGNAENGIEERIKRGVMDALMEIGMQEERLAFGS